MIQALRRRWQQWWSARHPARDDQLLTQRNLYIVPTKVGAAFLLTQAVLLVAAINDQLSLGYALTFLLAGAGLASMHTTHGNLRGLSLALQPPEPGHADQDLPLVVRLHNPGRARWGVGLQCVMEEQRSALAWVDVPAQGHAELRLAWRAPRRGHHALPLLRIESRFPLGLFVAWSYWRPASRQWAYPALELPCPPLPTQLGDQQEGPPQARSQPSAGDEFHQLRGWRDGDRLRDVLWKRVAQSSDPRAALWVVERDAPSQGTQRWLDLTQTQGLDEERRWQRLASWVLALDAQGQDWGLRLPGFELPPGQGPEQRRQALERLTLA
ncbi:uncharacterized protein (DUF58 family) [Inhella inkyongensis]|uniref:Uncharacterized protein (DUF58 family) n=1 Tax=Inhella inkyongensis TaxID=392593 RepID=A0A840S914_9BURK|nr:DUF58 domain-containing protein [Inhella inkyongensis]MBB5206133.1 uncharacterized protein (DUF58 family) [Inhella inkyongensis]